MPIAIKAREMGFDFLILLERNAREAAVVNQLKVYGTQRRFDLDGNIEERKK